MRILFITLLTSILIGCGTTSGLRQDSELNQMPDLSNFDNVIILDFTDNTPNLDLPVNAGKLFADKVKSAVIGTGAFRNVSRTMTDEKSLIINGDITRYKEGNATLRFMVGFGAGSSYFDAVALFQDSQTGEKLGELVVDRNSWALGGGIAASQTVEYFMSQAAEKIAEDLQKAKNNPELASQNQQPQAVTE